MMEKVTPVVGYQDVGPCFELLLPCPQLSPRHACLCFFVVSSWPLFISPHAAGVPVVDVDVFPLSSCVRAESSGAESVWMCRDPALEQLH